MQVIYEFTAHHAAPSEPPHQSAFNLLLLLRKVCYALRYKTKITGLLPWKNTENCFLCLIFYSHTSVTSWSFLLSLQKVIIQLFFHSCPCFREANFYTIMLLFQIICFSFLTGQFSLFKFVFILFSPFYVLWAISSYHSLALPRPFVALERLSLFFSHSFNLAGQKQNLLFLYCTINILQLSPQQVRVLT